MTETRVNGTQADEAQGAEADGTLDGDTLAGGGGSDGLDVERLRRLRLSGFLRELVRAEGRMEAAELLGVAYRTLVKAEESGEITGRMGDALERLLGTGGDPEAARLRERVGVLEEGMEALAKELRAGLAEIRAAVAGVKAGDNNGDGQTQTQAGVEDEGAGRSETGTAPPVAGLRPKNPFTQRRLDPEIVTEVPADDDAEVYGAAWPLVEEWRRLRAGHPHQGKEPVVARDGGAAARAGAGDAGGARADAAPGEAAPAWLRAQGTDQLALEGAPRHAGGVEKAKAAAVGQAGLHPRTLVEVGRGCDVWPRCHVAASDFGRAGPRPPRKPSIRSVVRVIIDVSFWLFPAFPAPETWRVHP